MGLLFVRLRPAFAYLLSSSLDIFSRLCFTPPMSNQLDISEFDVHECGQLRLTVEGEQVSLLPLPDELIPAEPTLLDAELEQGV